MGNSHYKKTNGQYMYEQMFKGKKNENQYHIKI